MGISVTQIQSFLCDMGALPWNFIQIRPVQHFSYLALAHKQTYGKTRNMGHNPAWGRPAPQVRLEIHFSRKSPVGWFNMNVYNFLVSGPKFTQFFRPIGMKCSWSSTIQIIDKSMHSWDIRDQSRKLSKIASNCGLFCPPKFCRGHPL